MNLLKAFLIVFVFLLLVSCRTQKEEIDCSKKMVVNPEFLGCDYTLELAKCYHFSNDFETALLNYQQYLKHCDTSTLALVNTSDCYFKLADTINAEKFGLLAYKSDPKSFFANFNLAAIRYTKKDYQGVIDIVEKGIDVNEDAEFCYIIFESYWRIDNIEASRKYIEKAIFLNPSDDEFKSRYAALLCSFGEYDTAKEITNGIINRTSNTSHYYYSLTDLLITIHFHLDQIDSACYLNQRLQDQADFKEEYLKNLEMCK